MRIADVQSAHYLFAAVQRFDNRQYIHQRQVRAETILRFVQNAAQRRIAAAHRPLHAVERAQIMTLVDPLSTARADEYIFGVVRHANYFVRDNLAERQDQIVATFDQ